MSVKLPKQWRHWCKLARLRLQASKFRWRNSHRLNGYDTKRAWRWFYLEGHGRVWRVNDKAMFECGDTYEEFDRWALCTIKRTSLPKTRDQFLAAVKALLAEHRSDPANSQTLQVDEVR